MPNISIDVNSREALHLLNGTPAAAARALEGTYNDASALALRELKSYPPQRAGSTYKRTRTLGRSWSRAFGGSGLERWVLIGSNENIAPYNRAVQDETRQARVHRGRWTNTAQNVARIIEPDIGNMFEARVREEIGRLGG